MSFIFKIAWVNKGLNVGALCNVETLYALAILKREVLFVDGNSCLGSSGFPASSSVQRIE